MRVMKSFCSAFLMYSRIPMPTVEWREENRRYALCFFPLIGAVIGGLYMLWYLLSDILGIDGALFGVICTVIPIAVTGGIHVDGFCDVNDAKACCGSREKMLEVMSDSRVGAFAVINLCMYLLLQTGFCSMADRMDTVLICGVGFVLSRALSGLAAVTFKSAKGGGALQNFAKPAHKTVTVIAEIAFIALSCAAMVFANPICGSAAILGNAAVFLYYRLFSYKKFGGITGDLAGYFLQLSELGTVIFAVSARLITEAL